MALAGCADRGPPGAELHGTITWNGQPVPAGYVLFTPDVKKGNTGHQGMAAIHQGRYDTREKDGRRVGLGHQVAAITGYDGVNPTALSPAGFPLFQPFEQSIEVTPTSGELNLIVPDTVPRLPKQAAEEF